MKTNAKIIKSIWTALVFVFAGLATGGGAWAADCNVGSGDTQAAPSDRPQSDGLQDGTDAKPISRLDPELYSYLHDPQLHHSDGLGQDSGDFSGATH